MYKAVNLIPHSMICLGPCLLENLTENIIQNRSFNINRHDIWTIYQNCSTTFLEYQTNCTATGWSTDIYCSALGLLSAIYSKLK